VKLVRPDQDVRDWLTRESGNGHHVAAGRDPVVLFVGGKGESSLFVALDEGVTVVTDLAEAARAQALLLVVPAQAVRAVTKALAPLLAPDTPVIVCAKGIERGTQKFMTEILGECAPDATPVILSGPSFAADVARGLRQLAGQLGGIAHIELFTRGDPVEGDFRGWRWYTRAWAERAFRRAGLVAIGLQCYTGRERARELFALERTR